MISVLDVNYTCGVDVHSMMYKFEKKRGGVVRRAFDDIKRGSFCSRWIGHLT